MKKGQKAIYFGVSQTIEGVTSSPYYEPFNETGVPVLVINNELDEFTFQAAQEYKNIKFENIEQVQVDKLRHDLGLDPISSTVDSALPEEDVSVFCLWMKNVLQEKVKQVTLSKRLKDTPAVAIGQVSSSMMMIM